VYEIFTFQNAQKKKSPRDSRMDKNLKQVL